MANPCAPPSKEQGIKLVGYKELKTVAFYRDLVAEFLGTFFLVSFQLALPMAWGDTSGHTGGTVAIGVGMAFVLVIIIEVFAPFGGANFNPAVSISLVVAGKISILRALFYVLVQLLAGIVAAYFIYGLTPHTYAIAGRMSGSFVNTEIAEWRGFFVEMWLTSLLLFAVLGSTNEKRRPVFMPSIPIGFTVGLDIMAGIKYTGGSMNPARSFGPALVMNDWTGHWVYWLGPILGGLLATAIYCYFLDKIGDNKVAPAGDLSKYIDVDHVVEVIKNALEAEMSKSKPKRDDSEENTAKDANVEVPENDN